MIEFRWVILLALWSLLIGPVVDLAPNAPTRSEARAKTSQASKAARGPVK